MGFDIIHTDWETLYYLLTDTTILNDIYQSEEKISIYGQIRGRKYIGNFISDLIGQTSSLHRQIQTFWSKGSKGKKVWICLSKPWAWQKRSELKFITNLSL